MGRYEHKLIKLLGVEGKKVDIVPQTINGINCAELHCKNENMNTSYMGMLIYDKRWKKFVLAELHSDFQMSFDCIKEAFEIVEREFEDEKKEKEE